MADFDLVALVVQSKKALQHAESVCSRTDQEIRKTSTLVVDILSNDSRVRWMKDGVMGQLSLAATVAESITVRRSALSEQLLQWESEKSHRTGALDSMLEMLSQRLVPPTLHLNTSSSSLFGSQHESLVIDKDAQDLSQSGSEEISATENAGDRVGSLVTSRPAEKSKWKTLRDFVDERGIDEVIDRMDSERATLEDYLAFTASHAESIFARIGDIKARLPLPISSSIQSQGQSISSPTPSTSPSSPPGIRRPFSAIPLLGASTDDRGFASEFVRNLLSRQHTLSLTMAQHLESLARHYDQISNALRDTGLIDAHMTVGLSDQDHDFGGVGAHAMAVPSIPEGGHYGLSEQDAQVFQSDTELLPSIIADIEDAAHQVDLIHDSMGNVHQTLRSSVEKLRVIMDVLDLLGNEMITKVEDQGQVENDTVTLFDSLSSQLIALDELLQTYRQYNLAFDKLVVEMDRRKRNREILTEELEQMMGKLELLRDEEISFRERFYSEQGQYLPEDLCPFIADLPPKYLVQTIDDDFLPDLEHSVVAEARKNITSMEGIGNSLEHSNLM